MKYTKEELTLIWLDSIERLDYNDKLEIFELLKGASNYTEAILSNKENLLKGISEKVYEKLISSTNQSYLTKHLKTLTDEEIHVLTKVSKDYPNELKYIETPPIALYCKGNLELLKEEKFAIVGSRKTLPFIKGEVERITEDLIDAGLVVVTGICDGVDEVCLKTGLDTGRIISVVAGGFNHVYPSVNQGLMEKIAKEGLVISESLPNIKPMPYFFPVRNRIIAGLSKGVLVASGDMKSGTLSTAKHAIDAGRDVFAFPYNVNVPSGEACNYLISQGAKLTKNANDILQEYGIEPKEKEEIFLTEEERKVYEIIAHGDIHFDKLCSLTGKKTFELMPILAMMEIKRAIIKSAGNIYSIL